MATKFSSVAGGYVHATRIGRAHCIFEEAGRGDRSRACPRGQLRRRPFARAAPAASNGRAAWST
jgi:hypothetical protein